MFFYIKVHKICFFISDLLTLPKIKTNTIEVTTKG